MNRAITTMGFAFFVVGVLIIIGAAIAADAASHGISTVPNRLANGSLGSMGWVLSVLGAAITIVGYLSEEG